jgi:hypothetical protein
MNPVFYMMGMESSGACSCGIRKAVNSLSDSGGAELDKIESARRFFAYASLGAT